MKKQRIHQIVFLGMIVTQNQNVNRKFIQVGESEILINSQRIISHSRLDYKKHRSVVTTVFVAETVAPKRCVANHSSPV